MNRFNFMDIDMDEDWEEIAELARDERFEAILHRVNNEVLHEVRSAPVVQHCHFMNGMPIEDTHWNNHFDGIDDNESESSDENHMDPGAFINSLAYNPWMRVEGYGLEAPRALRSADINFDDDDDEDGYMGIFGDNDYHRLAPVRVNSINLSERPCNNCMINEAFPNGIFTVPLNYKELARIQTELAEPGEDVVPMATYVQETDDLIAQMLAQINGTESNMMTD